MRTRSHWYVYIVAAAAFSSLISGAYAECPTSSPDQDNVSCELPKTPCDPEGKGLQFPGVAASGKNCGNGVTRLVIGPVTASYSSMNEDRKPGGPVHLRNSGFGRGVTFGQRIGESTKGLELIHPSGSKTLYTAGTGSRFIPEDRFRGNLTELVKESATKVRLTDPRTKAFTLFERKIVANGYPYLPTLVTDGNGFSTQIQYTDELLGIPFVIRDINSGHTITFQTDGKGFVTSVTNADGVVTKLEYDKAGYLIALIQADTARTDIKYTDDSKGGRRFITLVDSDSLDSQAMTYYDSGALKSITNMRVNEKTDEVEIVSRTTFTYSPSEIITNNFSSGSATVPRTFTRTTFEDTGLFGRMVKSIYGADGAYNKDSNPGILLSTFSFGATGELRASYDHFGIGKKLYYNKSGSCSDSSGSAGGIPEMPIPTCVKGPMGEVAMTYTSSFMPLTITEKNSLGEVVSTLAIEYDKQGNVVSKRITGNDNTTAAQLTAQYDVKGFPTDITTVSTETATYNAKLQLVKTTLSSGSTISYSYDARGRVNSMTVDGETQSIATSVSDGGTTTTATGPFMSSTISTSFDGLALSVSRQRISGRASLIPSLHEQWGGLAADQSARASFDISSLQRRDEGNASPQSPERQLMGAITQESYSRQTQIMPLIGIRTTETSQTAGVTGSVTSVLSNVNEKTTLFPKAQKASDARNEAKRQKRFQASSRTGMVINQMAGGKVPPAN